MSYFILFIKKSILNCLLNWNLKGTYIFSEGSDSIFYVYYRVWYLTILILLILILLFFFLRTPCVKESTLTAQTKLMTVSEWDGRISKILHDTETLLLDSQPPACFISIRTTFPIKSPLNDGMYMNDMNIYIWPNKEYLF